MPALSGVRAAGSWPAGMPCLRGRRPRPGGPGAARCGPRIPTPLSRRRSRPCRRPAGPAPGSARSPAGSASRRAAVPWRPGPGPRPRRRPAPSPTATRSPGSPRTPARPAPASRRSAGRAGPRPAAAPPHRLHPTRTWPARAPTPRRRRPGRRPRPPPGLSPPRRAGEAAAAPGSASGPSSHPRQRQQTFHLLLRKCGAEASPRGTGKGIKDQISRPATTRNRATMSGAPVCSVAFGLLFYWLFREISVNGPTERRQCQFGSGYPWGGGTIEWLEPACAAAWWLPSATNSAAAAVSRSPRRERLRGPPRRRRCSRPLRLRAAGRGRTATAMRGERAGRRGTAARSLRMRGRGAHADQQYLSQPNEQYLRSAAAL